jgi:diguanylate cyclase (GGDEF)-like protein/PAS domain S-box-containing protein
MAGADSGEDAIPRPAKPVTVPAPEAPEASGAPGERLRAVERWLEEHPDAMVSAIRPDGTPQPMPHEIRLGDGHRVEDRTLLDLIASEDRGTVTSAFLAAQLQGQSIVTARLVEDPTQLAVVHYVDLRPHLPVILRLVAAADETSAPPDAGIPASNARPRVGIIIKDEVARIVGTDSATEGMLGWDQEDLVGRSTLEFIHPDDHLRAIANWMSMQLGSGPQSVRLRYRCRDGSWLWLETSNDFHHDVDGTGGIRCQVIDISEEMATTDALRRSEQLLRRLTETVPVGLCFLTPDRQVSYPNQRLAVLFGTPNVEGLAGLQAVLTPGQAEILGAAAAAAIDNGQDEEIDLTVERPDARAVRCRVMLSAVADEGAVIGALLCAVDVTELKTQATVDALTGLHNRQSILAKLRDALAIGEAFTGVIFLDLDQFKPVNDRYGHAAGDQLLISVADRLRVAVRKGDEIGRLGGDEFLVVCPALARPEDLEHIARRAHLSLQAATVDEHIRPQVGASIGMATTHRGGHGAEALVALADAAMYVAKHQRAGRPIWGTVAHTSPFGPLVGSEP